MPMLMHRGFSFSCHVVHTVWHSTGHAIRYQQLTHSIIRERFCSWLFPSHTFIHVGCRAVGNIESHSSRLPDSDDKIERETMHPHHNLSIQYRMTSRYHTSLIDN